MVIYHQCSEGVNVLSAGERRTRTEMLTTLPMNLQNAGPVRSQFLQFCVILFEAALTAFRRSPGNTEWAHLG